MTVMAQPAFEMGTAAFTMLLSRMQREQAEESQEPDLQLFPAELRVRGSTASPGA
jgi:DNA-binding LacI/PurR family transcriptional regulator